MIFNTILANPPQANGNIPQALMVTSLQCNAIHLQLKFIFVRNNLRINAAWFFPN